MGYVVYGYHGNGAKVRRDVYSLIIAHTWMFMLYIYGSIVNKRISWYEIMNPIMFWYEIFCLFLRQVL